MVSSRQLRDSLSDAARRAAFAMHGKEPAMRMHVCILNGDDLNYQILVDLWQIFPSKVTVKSKDGVTTSPLYLSENGMLVMFLPMEVSSRRSKLSFRVLTEAKEALFEAFPESDIALIEKHLRKIAADHPMSD